VRVVGPRTFPMQWPVSLVRMEMRAHSQGASEWVTANGRDFVNRTAHLRLAALGLIPLDPEIAEASGSPARAPLESRHEAVTQRREERTMATTPQTAKSKKKKGLASLTKKALREKLLATPTIPDHAWVGFHGSPEREKGEIREAFIRRVLG
jgi:hypothetical protein